MPIALHRASTRLACAAMASAALLATPACAATGPAASCSNPGDVHVVTAIASRGDDQQLEYSEFILECTSDGTVLVTDENGDQYESLEDFQVNNDLFEDGDQLLLPEDFPSMDGAARDEAGFTTMEAKKQGVTPLQVLTGAALIALVGGLLMFAWRRNRTARSRFESGESRFD